MMRKESFQGILLGIVIMCAVFAFITIAWAGFSSTLTINGSATVEKQSWKVKFVETVDTELSSDAYLTPTTGSGFLGSVPTSSDTSRFKISSTGLSAGGTIGTFKAGDDEVAYTWYIQNFGTFPATISTATNEIIPVSSSGSVPSGGNIDVSCANASGETYSWGSGSAQDWCETHIKAMLYLDTYSNSASPATVIKGKTNFSKDALAATPSDNTDVLVVKLVVKMVPADDGGSPAQPTVSPANIDVTIPTITFDAEQKLS
jgi:hypothetical protein